MGIAIADEAASRGADVTLILGPVELRPANSRVKVVNVESAQEMLNASESAFTNSDIAVMCAAVADYRVANPADKKIKREHGDVPTIELVKNPDIAATLGAKKHAGQLLVGFALETDNEISNAAEKMQRKNLDMIVLNSLRDKGAGFGSDTNKITIFRANGEKHAFDLKSKRAVAADILDQICNINGK
jgi:phosphopantothenoylcysteine decarboxylase/phosphopantothenate--cysteine ligase